MYFGGILVLLIPDHLAGAARHGAADAGGKRADPGGQARPTAHAATISGENQLGKIDPTSAAMNLVLLGFRGVAADLLWHNADQNEETKNWAELQGNVDAIIMLQPHFREGVAVPGLESGL